MRRTVPVLLGLIAALLLSGYALLQNYPKPQITSNAGKPAPDFTLQDSEGHPFTLSQQRGKNTVLLFYRGYW